VDSHSDTLRQMIGKKIRAYRKEGKLSLRDLAAMTDVGFSWLAKLEKGRINFGIDSLAKLLEALDVRPSELFEFDLPYS